MKETKDITLSELAAIVIKGFESNDMKFAANDKQFATLVEKVTEGFASNDRKFATIAEDLGDIKETMATKDDIKDMATKQDIARIENTMATASELGIVRRDVEILKEKSESHDGFAKEIDHVLSRVVVIENHVGITTPSQEY